LISKLYREKFSSMNDSELCWTSIEPIILRYKQTKGIGFIEDIYKKLNDGQKALFMYTVFSIHALNSLEEYFWWTSSLLIYKKAWPELKKGLLFYRDQFMVAHLEELISYLHSKEINFENAPLGLLKDDVELQKTVASSYAKFLVLSKNSTNKISTYIRQSPADFIQFM